MTTAYPLSTPGQRSVAWFHCFAGIAGDMALGSLLDAGADLVEVLGLLDRLPLRGWSLEVEPVLRGGVAASRAVVSVQDNVVVRTYPHIVGLIEEARLPDRVAGRALDTFAALADVEAKLHRRPVDQVHFHEVGGHDTIVDVVGTAAALEVLGVDEVRASPVATGMGMIRSAHGLLPNPAPAVVALLEGVPTWGRSIGVELTTPTGAALLAGLCSGFGPMPAMKVTGQGFGAGTRELEDLPNCTQVVTGVLIERRSGSVAPPFAGGLASAEIESTLAGADSADDGSDPDSDAGQPVSLLAANVDDATGEQLAHAVGALLEAGAHDAWLVPVVMKKGRPGTVVHALCDPSMVASLRGVIRETTGSLGVRVTFAERWPAARSIESVWIDGQLIRLKVSPGRVKAEYDDVARAARRTGMTLRDVAFRAEALWRSVEGGPKMAPGGSPVPPAPAGQPAPAAPEPVPAATAGADGESMAPEPVADGHDAFASGARLHSTRQGNEDDSA